MPAIRVASGSISPARIHRFGAVLAQTRLTARGTLTAGGGWSSPHPGGDVRLDWADTVWAGGSEAAADPRLPGRSGALVR